MFVRAARKLRRSLAAAAAGGTVRRLPGQPKRDDCSPPRVATRCNDQSRRAHHQCRAHRQPDGHPMDDAIRRSVERQFPELTGGYHLPRFAQVVAVADAPAGAGICDDFRPRYAVDIEVMGPAGEPDTMLACLCRCPPVARKWAFTHSPRKAPRLWCVSPMACRTSPISKRFCPTA